MAQSRVKMAQSGSKWLKMAQNGPKMGGTEHFGAILSHFNPILGCQSGGRGGAKAFGAVKKGVKMAQYPKKTEKLTVPPARSSIRCQQWVCTRSVNSRGCLAAERRDFLVNFFFRTRS